MVWSGQCQVQKVAHSTHLKYMFSKSIAATNDQRSTKRLDILRCWALVLSIYIGTLWYGRHWRKKRNATRWCLLRWIVDSSNRPFLKSKYQDNFARMLRYATMEVYSLSPYAQSYHCLSICCVPSHKQWIVKISKGPGHSAWTDCKISVFPYVSLAFGRYAAFIIELLYTSTVNF